MIFIKCDSGYRQNRPIFGPVFAILLGEQKTKHPALKTVEVGLEPTLQKVFILKDFNGYYVVDTEQCALWKSWLDFSSWNREELVNSRPDSESLRTRQPCYHARKMKAEKRKFDQALTKMLRAKAGASPRNLCQVYNRPLTLFKINSYEKQGGRGTVIVN